MILQFKTVVTLFPAIFILKLLKIILNMCYPDSGSHYYHAQTVGEQLSEQISLLTLPA